MLMKLIMLILSSLILTQCLQSVRNVDIRLGKTVFNKNCKICHGLEGKSDTFAGEANKAPDLTKKQWKYGSTQADVEKHIRKGAGRMPGFESRLTQEEIKAVAAYVRKLAGIEDYKGGHLGPAQK